MNKKTIKITAVATLIILALVLALVIWPVFGNFFKIQNEKAKFNKAKSVEEERSEKIKTLDAGTKELQSLIANFPYRLTQKENALDIIQLLESAADQSQVKLEISVAACPFKLCFSLKLKSGFNALLDFISRIETGSFANQILNIESRYQEKENIYATEMLLRVYTREDMG